MTRGAWCSPTATPGSSRSASRIENGKPVSPVSAARYARALGYSEEQLVRLALQDEIGRAGLHYYVKIVVATKPRAA